MWLAAGLLLCACPSVRAADLSFDNFSDGYILTTEVSGLTFSNAIVLTAGISLNEFEFPPFSGQNVLSDDGGPITITFDSPVTEFGAYFTYLTRLSLTALDAGSNQVGQVLSVYNSNLALSGDPGSNPNEFLQVLFGGGIASVVITADPNGFSFTMDGPQGIPEPQSRLLISCGFALILNLKRIVKHK